MRKYMVQCFKILDTYVRIANIARFWSKIAPKCYILILTAIRYSVGPGRVLVSLGYKFISDSN